MARTEKHKQIVDTGYRLFYRYGFNSIGVDRIISEAAVAKNTFYSTVKSKNNLIAECLEIEIYKIFENLESIIEVNEHDCKYSKVDLILKYFFSLACQKNFNGLLVDKIAVELVREKSNFFCYLEEFNKKLIEYLDQSFLNAEYTLRKELVVVYFLIIKGLISPSGNMFLELVD
ncbi:TetR/AcrR family transcriptional regulator [Acinetobacter sp. ESBL14]|uniref:TetR/AcrR family transcriptional regulator n=1 Tax=Acinetobacter sp. ESBL14 TaxID=3077329 RepID=UPI002FC9FE8E